MPRLAVAQTVCQVGDVKGNLDQAESLVAQAARARCDLLCFPELFTTGFVPERFQELAEPIPGPSTERLGSMARHAGLFLVAGLLEKDPSTGHLHNAAVLLSPAGTLLARYRKVFLYLGERDLLVPGNEPCVCDVGFCKLALTICYDFVFAEYVHLLVQRGAQLLVHPTAWLTTDACESWHCNPMSYRAIGMTRALENTVFFMSANLSGNYDAAGSLRAVGQSAVIAPWGEILAEAGAGRGVAAGEVDFSQSPRWREAVAPYLADREVFSWKPNERRPQ
jgi:predicted amidohydrolase